MAVHRVSDPEVKAVFASYPQEMRQALEDLRETILNVADAVKGVGKIEESLKWGQPAYRPVSPQTGTTLRVGPVTGSASDYALFFHCQTTLADDFGKINATNLKRAHAHIESGRAKGKIVLAGF